MRKVLAKLLVVMPASLVLVGGACAGPPYDCEDTLTCAGGGPASTPCDGVCVPGADIAWGSPYLVWLGAGSEMPGCPSGTTDGDVWVASGPPAPCGACACEPSTGACELPAMATAMAATCVTTTSTTTATPTNPPVPWDGSCTTQGAIPGDLMCGAGPCVQSLTVGPLTVKNEGCLPTVPIVPKDVLKVWTSARACIGQGHGDCPRDPPTTCAPAAPDPDPMHPPPPGRWTHCLARDGDLSSVGCPPGYPVPRVFAADYHDTRACSPCTCLPAEGGACWSLITAYTDSACSMPVAAVTATPSGPMCVNIPAGAALGSKTASAPAYQAGACQPAGGEPSGDVDYVGPSTFCCTE